MDELLHQLPAWGSVLLVAIYIIVKEIAPRINRASRERKERRSNPTSEAPPAKVSFIQHATATETADDVHRHMDRFERALEKHFESDKQQFELLRMLVTQIEIQGRTLQTIVEVLQEMKGAVRRLSDTQDALFRRILEDTGRFRLPTDPRG